MLAVRTLGVEIEFLLQIQPIIVGETDSAGVGSQILAALIVGLLIAFALQLVLTSLGFAIGVTVARFRPASASQASLAGSDPTPAQQTSSSDPGSPNRFLSTAIGLGALLTVNIVLFIACFLATTFSQVNQPSAGAVVGLVIWSAYSLILTWLSLTLLRFVIGSILGSAIAGFQGLFSTLRSVWAGQAATPLSQEKAMALIRQEVETALNPVYLRDTVTDYLKTLSPPQHDRTEILQGFAALLQKPDFRPLLGRSQIDRQTWIDLVHRHTQWPEPEVEQLADELEHVWEQAAGNGHSDSLREELFRDELLEFLRSATPDELQGSRLRERLEKSLASDLKTPPPQEAQAGEPSHSLTSGLLTSLRQIDFKPLMQTLWSRIDLSDLDVEEIWQQLQSFQQQASTHTDTEPDTAESETPDAIACFNTIKIDLESYLLQADLLALDSKELTQQFRAVLYDAEAAPDQIKWQLEALQNCDFAELLHQRQDLKEAQVTELADRLNNILHQVLEEVTIATQALEGQAQRQILHQQITQALQTTDRQTLASGIFLKEIEALVTASELNLEQLTDLFTQSTWTGILEQRTDLTPADIEQILGWFTEVGTRLTGEAQKRQALVQATLQTLETALMSYLRHTNPKRLTAKAIDRKLTGLLQEAEANLTGLKGDWFTLDRSAVMQILDRRRSLDSRQKQAIIEQLEATWHRFRTLPSEAGSAAGITDQIATFLTHYLQQKSVSQPAFDLNSFDLKQDLADLGQELAVSLAKSGDWRSHLRYINWQRLAEQLQQGGLSQQQVQSVVRQVRAIVRQLLKLPRRWAARTDSTVKQIREKVTDSVQDGLHSAWEEALEQMGNYFQSLNVPLDTSHIQEQLGTFLEDSQPRLAVLSESLLSALKKFSVNQFDISFGSIWDTIQNALKEGLYEFSRDSIMKGLKLQEEVPEFVKRYLLGQAEELRDRLLQPFEQIQIKIEQQLEELKQQTQKRAEATRRAVARVAWWLFAIVSTAAFSSAIAGVLATRIDLL